MSNRFPIFRVSLKRALTALPWVMFGLGMFREVALPGLYMDEINHGAYVPGMFSREAAGMPHFRAPDNYLENTFLKTARYPILGGSVYNTTFKAYFAAPFYELLGCTVLSHRLFEIFLCGLLMLAYQRLCNKLVVNPVLAALSAAAFASDPLFVFQARGACPAPLGVNRRPFR